MLVHRQYILRRAILWFALGVIPSALVYGKDVSISFAVVPQQAASKLARLWTPILNYLSDKTGYKLHFKTAANIPTFEQQLVAGAYDIAYMNPYHYTVFHRAPGYVAIAKEKDKRIKGIIVVRKDSAYGKPADLAGKTLSFPSPAAFAASVLPRAFFRRNNIEVAAKYVSSHDSVYYTVAKGIYPAGGGVIRTLRNVDPEVSSQLRILWTTSTYTPHAIAVHPRLAKETVTRLRQAMLSMHEDAAGLKLLQAVKFKGLDAASDADWDDVRSLGIKLLNELIQPVTANNTK